MKDTAKAQVLSLVRKMISRSDETKFVGHRIVNGPFTAKINGGSQLFPVLPSIAEGTDYNQRLGDKVKIKRIRIYGYIAIDTAQTLGRTLDARLLVLSSKNVKTNSKVQTDINISSMLDDGMTGGVPADGVSLANLATLAPVNLNQFRVLHDAHYKLSSGEGGDASETCENPHQFAKFDFTIKHPVGLDFDAVANGTEPTNYAPFLTALYTLPNGSNPGETPGVAMLRVCAQSIVYYDDA